MARRPTTIPAARQLPVNAPGDLENSRKIISRRQLAIADVPRQERHRIGVDHVLQFSDFTDRQAQREQASLYHIVADILVKSRCDHREESIAGQGRCGTLARSLQVFARRIALPPGGPGIALPPGGPGIALPPGGPGIALPPGGTRITPSPGTIRIAT